MKRLIFFVVLGVAVLMVMRKIAERAGPAIRKRCSEMCERMLANMPDSFPPNRMMADLEALKEQTANILGVLESRAEDTSPE